MKNIGNIAKRSWLSRWLVLYYFHLKIVFLLDPVQKCTKIPASVPIALVFVSRLFKLCGAPKGPLPPCVPPCLTLKTLRLQRPADALNWARGNHCTSSRTQTSSLNRMDIFILPLQLKAASQTIVSKQNIKINNMEKFHFRYKN